MDASATTLKFRTASEGTWKQYNLKPISPPPAPATISSGGAVDGVGCVEGWSISRMPIPIEVRERMKQFPALIRALAQR
jgi:hypothetical protein